MNLQVAVCRAMAQTTIRDCLTICATGCAAGERLMDNGRVELTEPASKPVNGARTLDLAGQTADSLRLGIIEGVFPPGTQMSETALAGRLGVARTTLREAYRLLAHDGLLVHRLNRGVFVPELGPEDLADIYRLRELIEPNVVRSLTPADTQRLGPLYDAVVAADESARDSHWADVVTHNIHFHQQLVALAGSPRLDTTVRRLLAELRLIFHVIDEPQEVYGPYVANNRHLYDGLLEGDFEAMATYLYEYLRESEAAMRRAFEQRLP